MTDLAGAVEPPTDTESLLHLAVLWLETLADKLDLDPDNTRINVDAVKKSTGDHRQLATQSLGESLGRMKAALALPAADRWRPISEAPRDGTLFLACTADGRLMIWRGDILANAMANNTPNHLQFPATNFMPLPSPPIDQTGEAG